MAITYGRKKYRQNNILYTVITAILICTVFLSLVASFYSEAENEAYEMLHIQTKQIKDDLVMQLKSDRENLVTMANFAASLYADGASYDRMLESFKPIGLFSNIGILKPNNVFVTKVGSVDLSGKISFEEEAARGEYISDRVQDLTKDDNEIIRSAVPIKVAGKTVGVLYGVIKPKTINDRYNNLAKELNAQLFVYNYENGNMIINSVDDTIKDISFLSNRKYTRGYSYEQFISSDNGYSSFMSIYKDEELFVHYSNIDEFGWGIMLGRYESQVFAKTHIVAQKLFFVFIAIIAIITLFLLFVVRREKQSSTVTAQASNIRKLLLEINQQHDSIFEALKKIISFSGARAAFFVDTDAEDYYENKPNSDEYLISVEERKKFVGELFRYAAEYHNLNKATVGLMCIRPNSHLVKTNQKLYNFMKEHAIKEVSFATVTNKNNQASILCVINPQKSRDIRILLADIAVCFSIAIYNKKHLNRTEAAATTDALTGVMNRVAYKRDICFFDKEMPEMFTCIYIDVNELHIRNNRYGHAAGDEMLLFIANTLKEVFYDQYVYRMGGDEFLVFAKGMKPSRINELIEIFIERLDTKQYKVAIGTSFRQQKINCEEMVREAEIRMYEAKSQYYQNKETTSVARSDDQNYLHTKTGIREIDTMISVMKEHYNGIYRVSLKTDHAHRILMPAYLGYNEDEKSFSRLFKKYIEDIVHPDFQRAVMNFLNYDAIIRQFSEGKTPKIKYKKVNGETVILSVYKLDEINEDVDDALWVFAKG